jgi:pyruvate/2-oxoglutarate dehydrogenase complex dihydrolipoamide dehydrogenase (E3) component
VKGLWRRSFPALKTEAEVLQAQETRDRLKNNGVDLFIGIANLLSADEATFTDFVPGVADEDAVRCRICRPTECVEISARHVCIASGSRPNRPDELRPG